MRRLLLTAYHTAKENDLSMVEEAGAHLAHVQVAGSNRLPPGYGSFDFPGFFAPVHGAGYKGRVSVECVFADLAKGTGEALRFLKEVEGESHSKAKRDLRH